MINKEETGARYDIATLSRSRNLTREQFQALKFSATQSEFGFPYFELDGSSNGVTTVVCRFGCSHGWETPPEILEKGWEVPFHAKRTDLQHTATETTVQFICFHIDRRLSNHCKEGDC